MLQSCSLRWRGGDKWSIYLTSKGPRTVMWNVRYTLNITINITPTKTNSITTHIRIVKAFLSTILTQHNTLPTTLSNFDFLLLLGSLHFSISSLRQSSYPSFVLSCVNRNHLSSAPLDPPHGSSVSPQSVSTAFQSIASPAPHFWSRCVASSSSSYVSSNLS